MHPSNNFIIVDDKGMLRASAPQLPDAVKVAILFGIGTKVLKQFNGIAFKETPLVIVKDIPEDHMLAIAEDRHQQWVKEELPGFMVFPG